MWSQLSGTFAVNAGICFLESQGSFHELSWGPWPSWKGICFQGKRSKSQTDAGWVSDTTEERTLNQGLGSEVIRVLPAGMSLDISGQWARWDKERLLLQDGSAWPGLNPPLLMILPPPNTPWLLLPGVLELPPAQHRAWGSKTPFPDSSFPLSNAEVELSPTSALWSFTFCFAPAGAGGARRALVALELLGGASRESMLDAASSSGNAELLLLAKAQLQLKFLGIAACASGEIWC